jgi:CRISPR system Cascade subunit CasA
MTFSFNLIDRPWLPCLWLDGRAEELSLRDVFTHAMQLADVRGDTPPETAALYRLLLAILYRAFDEPNRWLKQWEGFWRAGIWDTARLEAYLTQVQPAFDLFDPHRPFWQAPNLESRIETVSSLRAHLASGADATWFDHTTEASGYPMTAAQAARALVAIQAFGLAGTKGPTMSFNNAPCSRGVVFVVKGQTLFKTLMLNLFDPNLPGYGLKRATGDDRAIWEVTKPFAKSPKRPYGYLDYLTWPNRRVLLLTEDGATVREMRYEPGIKVEVDVFNPMMHWEAANKKGKKTDDGKKAISHYALPFRLEKAFWRDSVALLAAARFGSSDPAQSKPPAAFNWIDNLIADGVLSNTHALRYEALGMCTKSGQDKTYFYRAETMPLPLAYLNHDQADELVGKLGNAMKTANQVEKRLYFALNLLAELVLSPTADQKSGRKPDGKDVNNLLKGWDAETFFWNGLERPFQELLITLPDEPDKARDAWHTTLGRRARQAFDRAALAAGTSPRAHKAIAQAEAKLNFGLKDVFK